MKERELRECATCAVCGHLIGKASLPVFWRVRLEYHGVDVKAVQRQQGLAMMLGGNGMLAAVMGPDEEMTKPLMEPGAITVCHDCGMKGVTVAELADMLHKAMETPTP